MTKAPPISDRPDPARAAAAAALPDRVAFLGFGLIAGSIAMAIREAGGRARIAAWTPEGRGPVAGAERGLLDRVATTIADAVEGADLVVLAGPPLAIVKTLESLGGELAGRLAPGATITDVGSTKARIVAAADAATLPFVGGHPMAGREVSGVEGASPTLFVDRPWAITPGGHARPSDIARVEVLATSTGARPIRMSADDHDAAVAAISHLPLVVAAALVESVAGPAVGGSTWPLARRLAATGWADMTRLARGDPEMGAGIVATNQDALAARLIALRDVLQAWIDRLVIEGADPAAIRAELLRARTTLAESEEP